MTDFAQQVATVRAFAGELEDPELHAAIDHLHEIAVEADDLDVRFHAAYEQVKDLLTRPRPNPTEGAAP
jgi:hypothetical protein